ncbi:VWA domain-containing protein [Cytobacillus depressus]|uniref:VWA domain-containing protein n=1 Tax=Cytobacillus depressus TaxID=1602942 RepID=A0A6L3V7T5_9BACI|nr:VWA domain-containing protein [Cytobacillus depressus]KAB2337482.1 VWA domain-containing protein [Cytobacillus depressus]
MGIEFAFPILLWLWIPAAILVFRFIKKKKQLSILEAYWLAGIRLVIFTLLILALTIPQILLPAKGETIIFLADQSASVNHSENEVLEWIEKSVNYKQKEDTYAIVTFGEDVLLEQSKGSKNNTIPQFNGKISNKETNIEAGIHFASSLIPRNSSGRIVLLSDGNETIGNSGEAANLLKNRNIELDYVLLKNQVGEDMSLSEMHVPPSLYKGEEALISFIIQSNAHKKAHIRLSVNNKEILKEIVDVKDGKNVYTFSHKVDTSGLSVYKGEITAEDDTFIENNILHAVTNIKGTPKVLIVQGKDAGSLSSILANTGVEVETIPPEKLPTVLSSYLQYQSIIFNNVPATVMSENQMNMIEKAVKEFGTGFVMAGGEESFGLGGYFKTPIEKLLPVEMDIKGKQEMPSLGLVIVMDRSGSMAGSKLELAKEAAARSVELLREDDTLGFIAFDDRPWVIVETKPLKDKKEAADKIRSVTPGGGTEIYSSLELAFQELEDLKLQRKHIILLTDGQAPGGDYEGLIERGKEKNITLSTVALGSDADRGLLEELADMGSGRFYDVTDSSVIPSILSRETVMATRTYIEDNPFFPHIRPFTDWLKMFQSGVPKMNAYIATTPKQRAQIPMMSEKEDPILAEWQYGLGSTIAFTSDFSGKWSGDFARWENWPSFINYMVTKTLPQFESEPYKIALSKEDGVPKLTLESSRNQSLPIEASLVSESGELINTNSKLVAPGKYEISLPNQAGMFFLSVKQTDQNGDIQTYQTGFTIPYSNEYLLHGPNENLLKDLANKTGGKALAAEKEAFRPLQTKTYRTQPISQWLILAAFLLFFLEIAIRRFGLIALIGHSLKKELPKRERTLEGAHRIEQLLAMQQTDSAPQKPESQLEEAKITKVKRDRNAAKSNKVKKRKEEQVTQEERAERMKRLLEAKNRKK